MSSSGALSGNPSAAGSFSVGVTVTDRKGNLIDGLSVDDVVLTDEGKPQKIRMDTSDTVLAPVSMVLLIQSI